VQGWGTPVASRLRLVFGLCAKREGRSIFPVRKLVRLFGVSGAGLSWTTGELSRADAGQLLP
jgi:hypothetical protein